MTSDQVRNILSYVQAKYKIDYAEIAAAVMSD